MSSAAPRKISKHNSHVTPVARMNHPLHACVKGMLENYFADMDGHKLGNLFEMVMDEVELPVLEIVLQHTRGNQSRAADILGLNRGTLRKKLRKHGLE